MSNKPWREVTTPTEVGHCAWGFAVGRNELPEWCELYEITDITMGEWGNDLLGLGLYGGECN